MEMTLLGKSPNGVMPYVMTSVGRYRRRHPLRSERLVHLLKNGLTSNHQILHEHPCRPILPSYMTSPAAFQSAFIEVLKTAENAACNGFWSTFSGGSNRLAGFLLNETLAVRFSIMPFSVCLSPVFNEVS